MKHCSDCGEQIVAGQQFCRSCGSELVGEKEGRGFDARTVMFMGLFGALASGVMEAIAAFLGSNTLAAMGFVTAILSFVVMGIGGIAYEHPRRSRKAHALPDSTQDPQPTLANAHATNRLPPVPADDHFHPSVTEHTTTKLRRE